MSELAPCVSLAEKLGRLAVQLVTGESGSKGAKVVYTTTRAPDDLDTRLLRAMVTKGIVEPVSSTFVNLVNADYTAKQRGLRITEERVSHDSSATAETPLESIQVRFSKVQSNFAGAISDGGDIVLEGRVKYGVPHLNLVGPYEVDVSLEGNLILCRQVDQPGMMIGKVGNVLGQSNVNINFMSVGRTSRGKQAIMAIGVDEEPNKETLKKIGAITAIEEFVFLELW
jgi:D-3-phosphoglycerate dehydrogenase / 2-oxoglutarate reductase